LAILEKRASNKKEDKPNSVAAAAAAATIVCPSIASLISNFTFEDEGGE
jgi:hypothetical protein